MGWTGTAAARIGGRDRVRASATLAAGGVGEVNYRHAFHAGNFADCVKHALLIALLRALLKKPAPLFVLDTHAGAGHYDLESGPAARTREAADGIARLLDQTPAPLEDYVTIVRGLGLYPG